MVGAFRSLFTRAAGMAFIPHGAGRIFMVPKETVQKDFDTMTVGDLVKELNSGKEEPFSQRRREAIEKALIAKGEAGDVVGVDAALPMLADKYEHMRRSAIHELSGIRNEAAIKRMVDALNSSGDPLVRKGLAEALGQTQSETVIKPLMAKATADKDPAVRAAAVRALGYTGSSEAAGRVGSATTDGSPIVRLAAVETLVRLHAENSLDKIKARLGDSDPLVRGAAYEALGTLDPSALKELGEGVSGKIREGRIGAILGLVATGDLEAARMIAPLLSDPEWTVRSAAISALVDLRDKAGVKPLIERLKLEKGRLLEDLFDALKNLTGVDNGRSSEAWAGWWGTRPKGYRLPPKGEEIEATPASVEPGGTRAVVPPGIGKKVKATDGTIFVVDVSGSMADPAGDVPEKPTKPKKATPEELKQYMVDLKEWVNSFGKAKSKIQAAGEAINKVIQGMPAGVLLGVWALRYKGGAFSGALEKFSPRLVKTDQSTKTAAGKWATKLAAKGWGDFWTLIDEAYKDPTIQTITWFSDGAPSRGAYIEPQEFAEHLAELYKYGRKKVNFVIVGIKGTNPGFAAAVAGATGGEVSIVYVDEKGNVIEE